MNQLISDFKDSCLKFKQDHHAMAQVIAPVQDDDQQLMEAPPQLKELGEFADCLVVAADSLKEALKDGFQVTDVFKIYSDVMPYASKAIEGVTKIPAEFRGNVVASITLLIKMLGEIVSVAMSYKASLL